MAFGTKETSRDGSNPAHLYLFRGADPAAESLIRSVTMGPGDGEFVYGTTQVSEDGMPVNFRAGGFGSDFLKSLNELVAAVPGITNVTLIVAWHGSDLRAGSCLIRPRVETSSRTTAPYEWRAGSVDRGSAVVVSQSEGAPAFGGAPSDRAIFEALSDIRARGIRATLMPVLLMDIPGNNSLPDPYGTSSQAGYPWAGRITCNPAIGQADTVDGTAAARAQIEAFFGSVSHEAFSWNSGEMRVNWQAGWNVETVWNYRKFVLHMATIAKAANVNDFLIGSELVGLTNVRDNLGAFPAVDALRSLASGCRSILGSGVRISYAAHWTEYAARRFDNNLIHNLDPLWADSNIDFVGINNFAPISDWRDGFTHLDWQAGFTSNHDYDYLRANIEGGESYDWTYNSAAARNGQVRSPIADAAHGEDWAFRQKDYRGWWSNPHHNRIAGVRQSSPTAWVAKSKPIVFTQVGCPAINKGSNWPGNFKASRINAAAPFFSNGRTDVAISRAVLEAHIRHWTATNEAGFVEIARLTAFTWDARPYPLFPNAGGWDSGNWQTGPWLTGRLLPGRAFDGGSFGPYAFTDAEVPITRGGITYTPWPIQHSEISTSSDNDKSVLTVTMATGSAIEDAFVAYPPSQVVNLTIFKGQMDDAPSLVDYPAIWLGRVAAPDWSRFEVKFECSPVSSSLRRPGLRRNYQIGCPHVLYGPDCRARKRAATFAATAGTIVRNQINLAAALSNHERFRGGLVEWAVPGGRREVRTIIGTASGFIKIRGTTAGLTAGANLVLSWGCDHTQGPNGCTLHGNILNYGGQDMIPLENPLSQKNQFY